MDCRNNVLGQDLGGPSKAVHVHFGDHRFIDRTKYGHPVAEEGPEQWQGNLWQTWVLDPSW